VGSALLDATKHSGDSKRYSRSSDCFVALRVSAQ
jgi:hypothetical protein